MERALPFQPGLSGNPGGRPKATLPDGRSLADIAREHTPAAIETLVEVMNDAAVSPAARVRAAGELLDRGWGRPRQEMDVEIDNSRSQAIIEAIEAGRARVLAGRGGEDS